MASTESEMKQLQDSMDTLIRMQERWEKQVFLVKKRDKLEKYLPEKLSSIDKLSPLKTNLFKGK
jgi:hypothetical protein